MKFLGLDPIKEAIPIRPVAHYSMGGIEADINGATKIDGIWAGGEVACTSLHGANRLGTNSTAECLVWGNICGKEIVNYLGRNPKMTEPPANRIEKERKRIFEDLMQREGSENPYVIRQELRKLMDENMGVYRTGENMKNALDRVRELKKRFRIAPVRDKSMVYNTNLINMLETENLLDLAEITVMSGLAREESRGGHARRDFTKRDDEKWLKHSLVFYKEEGIPEIGYKPVRITKWKPVERKY
jgi:succinate dehydrogenase / fumarate reductase flavoprotein subunit